MKAKEGDIMKKESRLQGLISRMSVRCLGWYKFGENNKSGGETTKDVVDRRFVKKTDNI